MKPKIYEGRCSVCRSRCRCAPILTIDELVDIAGELDCMAEMLRCDDVPANVAYITKAHAADWAEALSKKILHRLSGAER